MYVCMCGRKESKSTPAGKVLMGDWSMKGKLVSGSSHLLGWQLRQWLHPSCGTSFHQADPPEFPPLLGSPSSGVWQLLCLPLSTSFRGGHSLLLVPVSALPLCPLVNISAPLSLMSPHPMLNSLHLKHPG